MRICIIATGSRGDVEPYVALGKGLAVAGHVVRLVTHLNFEAMVKEQALEYWPVEGDVQHVAQSDEMRRRLEGGNFLAIMSLMAREAKRGAIYLARAGLAACQETDVILAGVGGLFVGAALAEKLRLPLLQAHYIPFTPTSAYPSFLLPNPPSWLPGSLNRLSYHLAWQVMWQGFRAADGLARKQVLGLPPASFWGPFGSSTTRDQPILYGFSPAVIPPPPDWGNDVHVTGYWFLDPPSGWSPSPELTAFLESGPPPVFVGFGSMSSRDPAAVANLVLEAVARTGQRAIVLSGWSGLRRSELPSSVLIVESVPFSWLFPRVAAVVHHGGAGTTGAGLRAGVPSIIVPFFADQPFWGRRVADLGVGPTPIPRKKLTAERLAGAIAEAVGNETMRSRAAALGAKIRAENGVARAVAVIAEVGERGGH